MLTRVAGSPIRLGFYLARQGVTCSQFPEVPYRGIDRLPHLPEHTALQAMCDGREAPLANLWDRYWDAYYDAALQRDLHLARALRSEFLRHGLPFELVYAEVALIPEDLSAFPYGLVWAREFATFAAGKYNVSARLARPTAHLASLGYDIPHPAPSFHSAIYQPGLQRTCPDLPRYLNRFGLIDSREHALRVLAAANAMDYGGLPFCGINVWTVESG